MSASLVQYILVHLASSCAMAHKMAYNVYGGEDCCGASHSPDVLRTVKSPVCAISARMWTPSRATFSGLRL